MEYFVNRFHLALSNVTINQMYDEFCDYQTLSDEDIGKKPWEKA